MLFFFGTGSTHLGTMVLPNLTCTHCGKVESVTASVFSRYFHLFWIPVFPIGKMSVTVCQHCKQSLRTNEMPAEYRTPVLAYQAQARTPLTNFALLLLLGVGLVLIVVAGVIGKFKGANESLAPASAATETPAAALPESERKPALTPEVVGTRYSFSMNDKGSVYGFIQVTKATPDSVYFRVTDGLRGEKSDASASLALRDSVSPANVNKGYSLAQWRYYTAKKGPFKLFE